MQTWFEVLFILALVVPPLAVAAGICAVLGSSFITVRTHAEQEHVARGPVAVHHPVGG
jgi:ABC-type Fe3+ transport system permease subunit